MTKIEWTDETWNPISGCNDVSEGCRHCYARAMAGRLEAMGSAKYAGLTVMQGSKRVWTGKISFDEKALLAPLGRKKPTRYFVNSMSDLFHPNVTDEMRDRIFAVMALCPQHSFQVLTKRPARMLGYIGVGGFSYRVSLQIRLIAATNESHLIYPLPNVWLGVSIEDQKTADERIPLLLQTPAAVRFLSAEPLLGAIDLRHFMLSDAMRVCRRELGGRDLPNLDWVICGGESGHGARPMHPDWARSLRNQCKAAGVPFFFKQHGEWISLADYDPFVHGFNADKYPHQFVYRSGVKNDKELPISSYRVGKKAARALLDGVEHREMPVVSR